MNKIIGIVVVGIFLASCAYTEFLEPTINVTDLGDGKKRIEYVCLDGTCQNTRRILENALYVECPEEYKEISKQRINKDGYIHSSVDVICK